MDRTCAALNVIPRSILVSALMKPKKHCKENLGILKNMEVWTVHRRQKKTNKETKTPKSVVDFSLLLLEISDRLDTLMTLPSVIGGLEKSVQVVLSDTFDNLQKGLLAQEKCTKELAKRVDLEKVSSPNELAQLRLD